MKDLIPTIKITNHAGVSSIKDGMKSNAYSKVEKEKKTKPRITDKPHHWQSASHVPWTARCTSFFGKSHMIATTCRGVYRRSKNMIRGRLRWSFQPLCRQSRPRIAVQCARSPRWVGIWGRCLEILTTALLVRCLEVTRREGFFGWWPCSWTKVRMCCP